MIETEGLVYKAYRAAEASNVGIVHWNMPMNIFKGVELTFAKQEIFNAQQQAAKGAHTPFSFFSATHSFYLTPAGIILPSGSSVFWRSSMTNQYHLFAWYWLLPVLGSIQAGKAAIDSVQASVVQHQTALAQAAVTT